MNLTIDIGNTLTKFAVFDGTDMVHSERTSRLEPKILQRLQGQFPLDRAIFSCVGQKPFPFEGVLGKQIQIIELDANTPLPITNSYSSKDTLGPDRLAAAVGAHSLYPRSNVLAIGCGTALTYDLVNISAEYQGGAISPGLNLRFKALHQFTAKLPLVSVDENFPIVGQTTHQSLLSGVQNGVIFEIDGFINRFQNLYSELVVVLTGGDANFFAEKLKSSIFVSLNMVLIGLNSILIYNE